jgi:predicted NBD/HSP70 family sugar kinase
MTRDQGGATADSHDHGTARPGRPRTIDSAQSSLATLLNLIRTGAATTRQALERQSELGRAAVTDRLAALTQLGLVEEGDLGRPTGGRAPRHMRFRANAGMILVAVVDRSSVGVGVADLSGTLKAEHHEAIDLAVGPQATLDRLTSLFDWIIEEHGQADGGDVWGIGIGVPGPVEQKDEQPFAAPALGTLQAWQDFPFVEALAARFGTPVWVRSGIQVMTMGEARSGAGAGVRDMLFVKLSRTISAGVISEGRLHRGAQGAAGMIGHSATESGTLEAAAGADAIVAEAQAAAAEGRSPYLAALRARGGELAVADVGHGAQLGDAFCAELLARCGRLVGEALAPLANLLNPSLVVLGGSVAETGDILLAAVREAVYRLSHPLVTRDLRILRSQMGNSSGLIGTGQVVAEELFAGPLLQRWITLGSPRRHPELGDLLARAAARAGAAPVRARAP